MKRHLTAIIIGKVNFKKKITPNYYLTPIRMAMIKKKKNVERKKIEKLVHY